MTAALLLAAALAAGKPAPAKSPKGRYYRLESLVGMKMAQVDRKVCGVGQFEKVKGLSANRHEVELWRCHGFSSLLDALDKSKPLKGWAPPGSFLVLGVEDGTILTAEASKGVDTGGDAEELYGAVMSALRGLHCKDEDDQGTSLAVTHCPKGGPGFEVVNHLMRESRTTVAPEVHTLILQASTDLPTVERLHDELK